MMSKFPSKEAIIRAVVEDLQTQLRQAAAALDHAQTAATEDEARPENRYDTRALEMSYLAAAHTERTEAVRRCLTHLHFWQPPLLLDAVAPGALVQLSGDRVPELVFIVPVGVGQTLKLPGAVVHVLSAQSPLAVALLGKQAGDDVEFFAGGQRRELQIVAVDPA